MGLINVVLILIVAIAALMVLIFDALSRVLVAAVGAVAQAPWRVVRSIERAHENRPVTIRPAATRDQATIGHARAVRSSSVFSTKVA